MQCLAKNKLIVFALKYHTKIHIKVDVFYLCIVFHDLVHFVVFTVVSGGSLNVLCTLGGGLEFDLSSKAEVEALMGCTICNSMGKFSTGFCLFLDKKGTSMPVG